ncbi:hypothetical protein ACFV9C_41745 [Kribbella sp. NPDC059898]|uniref:hypothetical protein n=1 Tax=Kribbella sp. NPDC059898 TaxID=3346995 RepID=UPI00365B2633
MDDVPASRVAIGVYVLAAETVAQGVVFFDDDGQRWEVVSKPLPLRPDRYLATIRRLGGERSGNQLNAELRVGRRVN